MSRRAPSRQPASPKLKFNKIPAEYKLSAEGEELRRILRQDLRDMKEAIALSIGDPALAAIQRMRLEMQELFAQIQKAHESPSPTKQDGPSFGDGATTGVTRGHSPGKAHESRLPAKHDGPGFGYMAATEVDGTKSAAMLLRHAVDAQEQEMQRLGETVDNLAALLKRAAGAEAERLQGDGSAVSGIGDDHLAEDIRTALGELNGCSFTGSRTWNRVSGTSSEVIGQATSNGNGTLLSYGSPGRAERPMTPERKHKEYVDPEMARQETMHPFSWEWERSNNKGWAPYTRSQSHRIEKAWRSGASRVRLRSGTEGKTPMELFLVDMLQLDPVSKNTRTVRRVGDSSWWMTVKRHVKALYRQVKTGEPRWESYEAYAKRQAAVVGPSVENVKPKILNCQIELELKLPSEWRSRAAKLWSQDWVSILTLSLVFLQAVWVYIDVDINLGKTLYEKQPLHQFLDYFFCVFFLVELLLHLSIYRPLSRCLSSPWVVFDMVCVVGSVIEVFVVPPLNALSEGAIQDWVGFGALRAIRLAKVIRIWRVFSAHSDFGPFFKGLWSGMRSCAFIWIIIAAMLYFFGVLLRLYAQDDIRVAFFPSVFNSMLTLMVKGVMLDEVGIMVNEMVSTGDILSLFFFLVFVWITYFNLLNMLVGAFCSVAGDVSAAEKTTAEIEYLKSHLESIVECYVEDEDLIGKAEFDLIMGNADVHRTLEQSGTDMEEIKALEKLLFHNKDMVDFDSLFQAIIHFRKGKTATVKDILNIQESVSSRLRHLEQLLVSGAASNHVQVRRGSM